MSTSIQIKIALNTSVKHNKKSQYKFIVPRSTIISKQVSNVLHQVDTFFRFRLKKSLPRENSETLSVQHGFEIVKIYVFLTVSMSSLN